MPRAPVGSARVLLSVTWGLVEGGGREGGHLIPVCGSPRGVQMGVDLRLTARNGLVPLQLHQQGSLMQNCIQTLFVRHMYGFPLGLY